jgi:glycosyltransferase involved in cell wall biosynthesis
VIPGGVDHARFRPLPEGEGRGDYVLTVASRTARKNLGALRETARRLRARGLELVAAGGDRPQFAGEAADGVRALGHVPDDELPALYARARAFVLPSLHEGFGLTCLEAMACGTPVVAARAGALPETCGDAALYADPRDPASIAAAVERAVEDPTPLRAAGLERAHDFSWEETARRVHALLRDLARDRAAR